jgi:hypothetical protein
VDNRWCDSPVQSVTTSASASKPTGPIHFFLGSDTTGAQDVGAQPQSPSQTDANSSLYAAT